MNKPPVVLMIAFHFPPLAGSSGIQRTLRFVQHLPEFGWQPVVLSAHPRAYERTSDDLMVEVSANTPVTRAAAWDTARHFAVRGRYIGAMARPDRWMSWRFDAVRQGLRLIREHSPAAIWSTYPIATAHLIGAELHRRTGLPWVADFRDPMAQDGYPADPLIWKQYRHIEEHALHHAAASLFTTPGAATDYAVRYPAAAGRVHVLENGYDEEAFSASGQDQEPLPLNAGAVTLLHSGIVYPSERDPTQLLAALHMLREKRQANQRRLVLRFRAPVAGDLLKRLATEHGVQDDVEILPAVPYRQALAEMLRADGLLVMQASNCNSQIPAKVYEYLRAGRPILCLADPIGDTAALVRRAGINAVVPLDNVEAIVDLIQRFLTPNDSALRTIGDSHFVQSASRRCRSRALADCLQAVVNPAGQFGPPATAGR